MLKIKKNVCSFIATHLNAPYQNYINIYELQIRIKQLVLLTISQLLSRKVIWDIISMGNN